MAYSADLSPKTKQPRTESPEHHQSPSQETGKLRTGEKVKPTGIQPKMTSELSLNSDQPCTSQINTATSPRTVQPIDEVRLPTVCKSIEDATRIYESIRENLDEIYKIAHNANTGSEDFEKGLNNIYETQNMLAVMSAYIYQESSSKEKAIDYAELFKICEAINEIILDTAKKRDLGHYLLACLAIDSETMELLDDLENLLKRITEG